MKQAAPHSPASAVLSENAAGALRHAGYSRMTGIRSALHAVLHRSAIIHTAFRGTESGVRWHESDAFCIDRSALLVKQAGTAFRILNITDIHIADYDRRALLACFAFRTIRRLVKQVKPDLITVTGDIVCTHSTVYAIRRFTDFMEELGIPWAPVFGNHDDEGNCDLNYLADIMKKSPHCLMKKGDPAMGVGNYLVHLAFAQQSEEPKLIASLFLMDTHHGTVNDRQLAWYRWAAEGISAIGSNRSQTAAFFHIPLAQYQYAFDEAWDDSTGRFRTGFGAGGERNEKICCARDKTGAPIDAGFFETARLCGTRYLFCGHEHMNDFTLVYRGVRLTYTLKVGTGSGYQPGFNGATVITVTEDGFKHLTHKAVRAGRTRELLHMGI